MTLREAQYNTKATIFTKSHIVLAYVDDIMISRDKRNMKDIFSNIETTATEFDLINKTKILQISRPTKRKF